MIFWFFGGKIVYIYNTITIVNVFIVFVDWIVAS